MNFIRKNIKLLIGIIIGLVIASTIAVYATINASQIEYIKQGTDIDDVKDAIDDLYNKIANTNKIYTQQDLDGSYTNGYNAGVLLGSGGNYRCGQLTSVAR